MPAAIPIVVGAFTAAEGVSAIAAGSALIGGLMAAGGALSVIGGITGNKYATRYGGLLSLAGGVANIGSNLLSDTATEAAKQSMATGASDNAVKSLSQSAAPLDSAASAGAGVGVDTASSQAAQALADNSAQAASTATAATGGAAGAAPLAGDTLGGTATGSTVGGSDSSIFNNPSLASTATSPSTGLAGSSGLTADSANQGILSSWFKPLGTTSDGLTLGGPVDPTSVGGSSMSAFDNPSLADTATGASTGMQEPSTWDNIVNGASDMGSKIGSNIKKYKEAYQLGSGIVGGAMQAAQAKQIAAARANADADAQWRLEQNRRNAYNASLANLRLPSVTVARKG